ncbi:FGGY-family carbohydrate kinase [Sciscionella marina]|uniref:FGGY-family carbohydrate kinase n=1 Tax=Sciscionella marina TaxID=508770 RepID=UPI000381F7FB|nr:FGGY-family carbohydrate kinase [Sciscionella marina]
MILGVDIGTSMTKAFLLDRAGKAVVTHTKPSTLNVLEHGHVEQDFEEVLTSAVEVIRATAAEAPAPVTALALTGQGDGLWLRDADGAAVGPAISWLDGRANPTLERWRADGTVRAVHRLTGSGMFPGSAGPLLAHLAKHEPERLERAAVAGYCLDWVVQRLTGAVTVDASDASLPFLHVPSRSYSAEAIEACGLGDYRRLLIDPAPRGTLFSLTREAATALGLPSGLPVSAGPFDLPACSLGAGVNAPGDGTIVVGTTLGAEVLTDRVDLDPESEPAGMWIALPSQPNDGQYLRAMPSMVGTASLDWVLRMVGADTGELDALLEASPSGANGVSALSFLSPAGERAPFVAPAARGQFTGLRIDTSRADLVRALCEGLAYAARHSIEAAGLTGELSACGGGMRSRAWRQIFVDVLGRDVHIPNEAGVGARGAALTAWDSVGAPVDREIWRADRTVIRPDERAMTFYEKGFRHYLDSVEHARPTWKES